MLIVKKQINRWEHHRFKRAVLRGDTGFRVSPLKILIVSGTASSLSRLLYVQCSKYSLRHCRRLRQPKRHRHIDMKPEENLWQHTVAGSEFPKNHMGYQQTPINNGINYIPTSTRWSIFLNHQPYLRLSCLFLKELRLGRIPQGKKWLLETYVIWKCTWTYLDNYEL